MTVGNLLKQGVRLVTHLPSDEMLVTSYQLPATSYQLPVTGHRVLWEYDQGLVFTYMSLKKLAEMYVLSLIMKPD